MVRDERSQHLPPKIYDKVVVTKPVDYVPKYQDFLGTTDEKEVISGVLAPLLSEGTVLDIGAGTGDIPDKLGLGADRYTAIEQRPEFIELLKTKGYSVIEKLFPCKAPKADNVLMSYVLHGIDQCEAMIDPAWELVDDEGQLVVVTFRDNEDDFNKLLHRIGHTRRVNTDVRFNYLQNKFSSLGEMAIRTTQSHIYGSDIESLAASISFIATNTIVGTPELRAELHGRMVAEQPYFDDLYKTDEGDYQFPMDHYIFTTQKS